MSEGKNLVDLLYEARKENKSIKDWESARNVWDVYGEGVVSYEKAFKGCHVTDLKSFVTERSSQLGGCIVLDLMFLFPP